MSYFDEGNARYAEKDYEGAQECYRNFLNEEPHNYIAWHNLGIALTQLGRNEEALEAFNLPCQYNYVESWLSRGVALRNMGKYREALVSFATTIALDPKHSTGYSNYGNTLREYGEPHLGSHFMKIALEFEPNNVNFQLNESVCHLMKGDLLEGWKNYHARWYYQSDVSFKPQLPGPEYDGTQDVNGKTVIVYYEQGFGDSIQFVRFVNVLYERGANIVLVTKGPLLDLFKHNFPYCTVIHADDPLPNYHYHVPLMDLPKCFGTTIDTIPFPNPYLTIDEATQQEVHNALGPKTKPRIGLLWSPNKAAFITRFRRIELAQLLSIVSDEFEFYSLAFDPTDEEQQLLNDNNIKSVPEHLQGFNRTGALLKEMDLVITIDTVTAHLSGALGVPTWVMLSDYGCDWRWFMDRNDSPFYNCMSLYRQKGDGDWNPVLEEIKKRLDTK